MAAQSYRSIARLRHRLQIDRLWTPEVRSLAYSSVDPSLPPKERNRAFKARAAARQLLDSLFPED